MGAKLGTGQPFLGNAKRPVRGVADRRRTAHKVSGVKEAIEAADATLQYSAVVLAGP